LSTACSSGTNAYVQSNVANLLAFHGYFLNKIVYNAEEYIARAEAEVNKAPNLELLDHKYNRLKKANTTILKEANITQDKAALETEMEKSMMEKLWKKSRKSVSRRRN
uniref:Uncharacterized protein n=1 Tax=Meloidogyne floridensis TaxID=298350 RepID=A0A915P5A6_9BILA